jgi:Mg-chelatase subunit ChlD
MKQGAEKGARNRGDSTTVAEVAKIHDGARPRRAAQSEQHGPRAHEAEQRAKKNQKNMGIPVLSCAGLHCSIIGLIRWSFDDGMVALRR